MNAAKTRHSRLSAPALVFLVALMPVLFVCTVKAQALLQAGGQAPEFALRDLGGNTVSLSQYTQKKAVVLVFWSTWSTKSATALKRFEDYYGKYGGRGIQVIGINAENQTIGSDDVEKIKGEVKGLGVTYPVVLDKELSTFHNYNVVALPSVLVIKEGTIVYELPGLPLLGTEDLFDYLAGLAGEPVRKKAPAQYQPRHDAIADANLARRFVSRKQYAMAYPLFQRAIDKDPKYLLPYVQLAMLYELEDKSAEAEGILKKALAAAPGNVVVMSELGYVQARAGNVKEALELLSSAAKDEAYAPAHYYLGYALGMNGRLKEALAAFERATALNPYAPIVYRLRAEVYEKYNMGKEAAADYRKALELTLRVKSAS